MSRQTARITSGTGMTWPTMMSCGPDYRPMRRLQDLDFWSGLGFSLVALVTVINAVEPFFNWRSRWVLMEEAQYRF